MVVVVGMAFAILFCYEFQNVLLYMKDAFDIINLPAVSAHDFKYKTPLMTAGKRIFLFNSDKQCMVIQGSFTPSKSGSESDV